MVSRILWIFVVPYSDETGAKEHTLYGPHEQFTSLSICWSHLLEALWLRVRQVSQISVSRPLHTK